MTGLPRLLSERCADCIFRPGNPMRLQPGRLAAVIAANRAEGTLLTCHRTTYGQTEREAICRGYWDAYGAESRVAQRMAWLFGPAWYEEAPPP